MKLIISLLHLKHKPYDMNQQFTLKYDHLIRFWKPGLYDPISSQVYAPVEVDGDGDSAIKLRSCDTNLRMCNGLQEQQLSYLLLT